MSHATGSVLAVLSGVALDLDGNRQPTLGTEVSLTTESSVVATMIHPMLACPDRPMIKYLPSGIRLQVVPLAGPYEPRRRGRRSV